MSTLGWVLSFEPPSLYSVTECIKRANRPKAAMRTRFPDNPELADIFGKFDEIVVDNGLEFIVVSTESSLADLGVSLRWAPIRSPTYKALIERFFLTLNHLLNKKLPGGTFPIGQMRAWELNPSKDAVLTLAQLEALLTSAIGIYHQELHTTLGDAPINVWTPRRT
jgi:putative transposase